MSIGYNHLLYLLPFDHRHSYVTGLFPWFKRHSWFERELVPALRARVATLAGR